MSDTLKLKFVKLLTRLLLDVCIPCCHRFLDFLDNRVRLRIKLVLFYWRMYNWGVGFLLRRSMSPLGLLCSAVYVICKSYMC